MSDAPIFVGGFVDIKKYPTLERELVLDHDRLLKAVPSFKPIPINVEHLADAEVGWVRAIYPASHGLFCIGEIINQQFLHLVTQLAAESAASHITLTKQLPREPTLQMLHTWLPELSLSSISPDLMNSTPDAELFHHVALCALGKRRGVVAVYGHTLEWVISKFESLKPGEVTSIKQCVESVSKRHGLQGQRPLNFTISMDSLLAKAIDASFIQNRLDLLKTDRQVAAVKQSAYLKASHVPNADPEPISQPTQSTIMTTLTPGMDDNNLISVPKATLISLLTKAEATQRPQGGQTPIPPILPPFQAPASSLTTNHSAFVAPGAGLGYPHAGQWPMMPPWSPYGPPTYPLQPQEATHQNGPYWPPMCSYGHRDEARAGKRKRECEEDDQVSFPGETNKRGLYSELLSMAGSIASLKSELQSLKQTLPSCVPPSTTATTFYPETGSLLHYPARHPNPQQCYVPHPSPAPLSAASPAGAATAPPHGVESVPHPPESAPAAPVTQNADRDQDTLAAAKKTVSNKRVDASKLTSHEKSKVQQLFCEELSK
ncbi:capsid maturation protease [Wood mouse herpesvirus]|uniref:Capsid scaffolding protein n=2 Tax=Wood mouse herpesvirus TaxID=432370 RepID=D0U1K6_9GAMA|nr:capsid maturation protease [Wood mouse herpesvirus]ACY41091.1 capsid maturation protease [Wood mouse herpesvirus]